MRISKARMERLLTAKRAEMRAEYYGNHFLLGGWIGCTDTYKRTMGAADDRFALEEAAYSLTMRRALKEPGCGEQMIMAGHETMLAQWFHKPLKRTDIELARHFYSEQSNVHAFPHSAWDRVLKDQKGKRNIHLPITIWGFPGGQTYLRNVPCMSAEGMGGIVTYIEPALCRYFAPVIIATKARLMKLATNRDAEVGLRAALSDSLNVSLLLARFVGSGGQGKMTSNDLANFLFPEYFDAMGTMGHELMCCHQQFGKKLSVAEFESMRNFVQRMGNGFLLPDLVDAETVGLENSIKVIELFPESKRVGVRLDSGEIAKQCVQYYLRLKAAGFESRTIVFESEVTPEGVLEVYKYFREQTGVEPTMLFPAAGGYFWRMVHRDTLSVAFKRTWTGGHPNTKFSNDIGKESFAGRLRVYGRGSVMIIADESETIDGTPLFVKLVDNGRIVYNESYEVQAARAEATWGQYTSYELSPVIAGYMDTFRSMREEERTEARTRLTA